MIINEDDYVAHYGTLHRSGRYPWMSSGWGEGSENKRTSRHPTFLELVDDLKSQGLNEKEIAAAMGIGTKDPHTGEIKPSLTEFRDRRTLENAAIKQHQINQATYLKDKGLSGKAIAERMGLPGESSVRALLAPGELEKAQNLHTIATMIKQRVDEKKYVDIGSGSETHINTATQIGVSQNKLRAAVQLLVDDGYSVHSLNLPQVGTGLDTRKKILVPPGVTQREVWLNRFNTHQIVDFSNDDGRTFGTVHEPLAIHPSRVAIRYKADGGDQADGVIFVRPGVKDVEIGKSSYAQVRIKVGDTHYLKGMAMYKDGLPEGKDLVFNTVKDFKNNDFEAMKPLEEDKDFPFKTIVRQVLEDQGTEKEHVSSVMNIVGSKAGSGEAGAWVGWSKNLSSQILSKQSPSLAKAQLQKTFEQRKSELDEIEALTNPVIKKKLLEKAAEEFDSASVHLKAATITARDAWHVILPISSMKPTEVFAPRYNDGEKVALIRYPHGGRFEIPELIVNNKNREARGLLGDAPDAIGIHHSVAQTLSGADFDGDTVLVIPNNQGKIKTEHALDGLKDFDPQREYPEYDGMRPMLNKQREMGDISNLITDMTLKAAPHSEIVHAIRHSMVVIDAKKHNLDYRESARREGIAKLKEKYQGRANAGASTIISKKKHTVTIPERRAQRKIEDGPIDPKTGRPTKIITVGPIDPKTGRQQFVPTGGTRRRVLDDGSIVVEPKTIRVKSLALTDDAHSLLTGTPTPMERLYADHSNRLKSLANDARLSALKTPGLNYSPSSKKHYSKEVASLNSKLTLAKMNRPKERQAQVVAKAALKTIRASHPDLDPDAIKKLSFRELEIARINLGAKNPPIVITQEEWNAIQAGAIHTNKLSQILDKADLDVVRKLATPRQHVLMTPSNTRLAKALLSSGNYTRAQVAQRLGVSLSTLDRSTVDSS